MVVVLDSTLLAENFDALVIAVRSLAAVVDDADCAVRELQGYDCSVDIVIIRIAGICEDCACCGNFCDIAAGQITDHVEVMDHHVGEDTAGNSYIRHRRASGIAGADLDNIGLAQLAGSDYIADCLVASVKAADETDLKLDTGLLDLTKSLVDLCDRQIDRLLAEDVLAGLSSLDHEICVCVCGRTNEDGVHIVRCENICRILCASLNADALCPCDHIIIQERICKNHDFCVRNEILNVCAMEFTDASATKKTDP